MLYQDQADRQSPAAPDSNSIETDPPPPLFTLYCNRIGWNVDRYRPHHDILHERDTSEVCMLVNLLGRYYHPPFSSL
jgi:hypothetical protein